MNIKHFLIIPVFLINISSFSEGIIKKELEKCYSFYETVENDLSIKNLVLLDSTLKKFINNLDSYEEIERAEGTIADYDIKYWEDKYRKIGIERAYSGPSLYYSNKFLADAYKIDPNSRYRKYTYFSTIFGIGDPSGLGMMPNVKEAYKYLKDFPDGPYIDEVYLILARFHTDLFMVVRSLNNSEKDILDYKYDCYESYIENKPYAVQMKDNQRIAVKFLREFLKIHSNHQFRYPKNWLEDLENGTIDCWSYCSD